MYLIYLLSNLAISRLKYETEYNKIHTYYMMYSLKICREKKIPDLNFYEFDISEIMRKNKFNTSKFYLILETTTYLPTHPFWSNMTLFNPCFW